MATLSAADQTLSASDQQKILAAKDAYAQAKANNNETAMKQAHADAEAIRIAAGYYGGATGSGNTSTGTATEKANNTQPSPYKWHTGQAVDTSSLSLADKELMSQEDQAKIVALKAAYGKATDQSQRDYYNELANTIRSKYHYTAGDTGTDSDYRAIAYGQGGRSADEMAQWLSDYKTANMNYGSTKLAGNSPGWTNGYSLYMNNRSEANMIRQQMYANEQAMNDSNRETLHAQNMELAQLLRDYTGQSEKNTYYNEEKGRWETWSGDFGYGYDLSHTQPNIRNNMKNVYGYTDEEMENWANDTSRYYNFVDTEVPARNTVDESSGYTGRYAQFVNGPYAALRFGTWNNPDNSLHTDVYGDGFGNEEYTVTPQYDENGNIIKTAPALKNNNDMSAYTAQFAPAAVNGVLTGQGASVPLANNGTNNSKGQTDYYNNYGQYSTLRVPFASSGSSGSTYENYLNQMYDAALQAQMASLESSYKQNISELDADVGEVNSTYREQKRQTTGTNAQEAAAWREMANAYGLNTGAVGQAALAQNNQLQSNLNALEQAEASALTEIERQKSLLGQQYQLQINEALAENNFNKAQALYQEAVRAEEALTQKQQFASQMMLQYAQLAQNQSQYETDMAYKLASLSGRTGSGGTGGTSQQPTPALYATLSNAIAESGMSPELWVSNKNNLEAYGYGGYDAEELLNDLYNWEENGNLSNPHYTGDTVMNIVNTIPQYFTSTEIKDYIWNSYGSGLINKNERDTLLSHYGLL